MNVVITIFSNRSNFGWNIGNNRNVFFLLDFPLQKQRIEMFDHEERAHSIREESVT